MQRKTFVLFITAVMLLAAVDCGKKSEATSVTVTFKPSVERIMNEGYIGAGKTRPQVSYVDRRNKLRVISYDDFGMNGEPSRVDVRSGGESQQQIVQYLIVPREEVAEAKNTKLLRDELFGGAVYYWKQSPEAKTLQGLYYSIRAEYEKQHPEAKAFEENQIQPPPMYNKKLEAQFRGLLAECIAKDQRAKKVTEGRASEVAQTLSETCESELYSSWEALPEHEQEYLTLTNEDRQLFYRAGIELDSRNPLRSVYEWAHTPQENDYKSVWSIYLNNEIYTITANYRKDLARRGLVETASTKQ